MLHHQKDQFAAHRVLVIIYMLSGSLVTTAWRVLRLRMEETPPDPDMEGSCKYSEQAVTDSQ
jgi:hypothetical protein